MESLIDELVEDLVYGRKVLLRSLRRAGQGGLLRQVASAYQDVTGREAVQVRPGDGQFPDQVVMAIRRELDECGSAVLLLEDWGRLMRMDGRGWQPRLNTICVDDRQASAIGVLMTADPGENLSRAGIPGSPLADAVQVVRGLPLADREALLERLTQSGLSESDADRIIAVTAGHPELLAAISNSTLDSVAERLCIEVAATVGQEGAARVLDLARRPNLTLAPEPVDERLVPIVYRARGGRTAISSALVAAGLVDLLPGGGEAWPQSRGASNRRLLARLLSGPECFWYDRYLYTALPHLTGVLDDISNDLRGQEVHLRLLSGPPRDVGQRHRDEFVAGIPRWESRGLTVQWHAVAMRDVGPLHDRQLIFRSRIDGYHLPPADRIVGQVRPGNENDAYIARAPLGRVNSAWARSSCWGCLPGATGH